MTNSKVSTLTPNRTNTDLVCQSWHSWIKNTTLLHKCRGFDPRCQNQHDPYRFLRWQSSQ